MTDEISGESTECFVFWMVEERKKKNLKNVETKKNKKNSTEKKQTKINQTKKKNKMSHLPIEITRMIYIFLGYFPCQGRLIPVKEVLSFLDKANSSPSLNWPKITIHFTKEAKYIIDRENDKISLDQSDLRVVWMLKPNGHWCYDRFFFKTSPTIV
jgi:hypothetical protein